MANLKNLPKNKRESLLSFTKRFLVDVFLSQNLHNPQLLLAYSGGLDSTVLLHVLFKLQAELPFRLSAMHVHHGLSDNADDWVVFCEKNCAKLNIPCTTHEVRVDQNSGLGIESAARNARYQALNSTGADFVCLAHHQDDQAETLLLQLARGAGVKGMAGMAQVDTVRKMLRPFLDFTRAELEAYAKQNHLSWINDESNEDIDYDRNFIRHDILPALRKRYSAITQTLSRTARNLAEANNLLEDLARIDAAHAIDNTQQTQRINLLALKHLSSARQSNLIRWWLAEQQVAMPSAKQLQQVMQQLLFAKSDALVKVKVADKQNVMRYQNWAYLVNEPVNLPSINLLWQGEEVIVLPNLSRLFFTQKMGEGLALERGGCRINLRIKNREGGERFKPDLNRPSRTLKQVLQSSEMPPWQREQLPLVFMDETLAIVPNVGVAASLKAESHEMGLQVTWCHA